MVRSARVFEIAGLLAAVIALAGCGGKTIHLGTPRDGGGLDGGCRHAQTSANEVLWIGDSWVLVPGVQHTRVRDLARAAGAMGPNDDYAIGAVAASYMADIANQYSTREASATKVKVVIMDGGTWDTIQTNGAATTVTSVVNTFNQFLAKVASDGTVEHVIYFLCPELSNIPGVAALRLPLQQACAQSKVACHFIDLQQRWAGHPEYTVTSGSIPIPSEAGGTILADEIWSIMQQNCIAQ
jgi:hypothetical protein